METKKKVKFLKDHVNGIKKGNVGEFNEARANYLVRTGVAEYVVEKEPKKAVKQTKENLKTTKNEPCKTC